MSLVACMGRRARSRKGDTNSSATGAINSRRPEAVPDLVDEMSVPFQLGVSAPRRRPRSP
ncbi:MAG TPA: hypothetical protein VKD67_04690 [Acidimicrobiales bacterium]|nr:hypothetical protein [Acidimicrobiales bacterium]